jgi:hypothetical protein
MPIQKKKEFQPPMAERVDFGFMDIKLVFQKGFLSPVSASPKDTTNRDCQV